MAQSLTEGAINRFLYAVETQSEEDLLGWEPTLQILIIKEIAGNKPGDPPRKRLILSDGNHFVQAMLATQRNDLVDNEEIVKFSIIKLTKFHASMLAGKRLIILIDLEILAREAEKIGEPKNIESAGVVPPPEPTLKPTPPVGASSSSTAPAPTLVNKRPGGSAISKPSNSFPIYPIEQLSPYQNKWTIKARVTQKSDIRNFSTARGEGKLFNVTLTDETGEIRGTAFNAAVDELFDKFQEGKVYFVSKARVNIAKKKFGGSTSDFELGLERHTEVEECADASNVPEVRYNFVDLGKLDQTEKDAIIDVLGVVSQVGDLTELTSKAGKTLTKRDITLVDRSKYSVRMTLWGKQAESFHATNNPVMAFKAVKVGDFGGRTLSMVGTSTYQENPDIDVAHLLRGWQVYDGEGQGASFNSQSGAGGGAGGAQFRRNELMTLSTVKDSTIGQGDNADFFSCRATIMFVKPDTVMYTACPADKCNKKVTQEPNGDWRCEKCDRNYPEPDVRYLMTIHVADHTNQLWLQAFNDVGQAIIGMTAKQLYDIEQDDHTAAQGIIERAHSKVFNFSCRAKSDTWNDQTRIRYGINRVWPLDYAAEGHALLDILKAY
ncbi:Replication factor A protein 1 [Tulasnella sp. 424]|nr:Replication factor A protein 1 [Tulasnella sp. 424]